VQCGPVTVTNALVACATGHLLGHQLPRATHNQEVRQEETSGLLTIITYTKVMQEALILAIVFTFFLFFYSDFKFSFNHSLFLTSLSNNYILWIKVIVLR
jgi:hypothetical protein